MEDKVKYAKQILGNISKGEIDDYDEKELHLYGNSLSVLEHKYYQQNVTEISFNYIPIHML